tara:strand:+ start:73 stop:321 length:249 start_codon:yes stop_codon:yes gene_type:complete
MYRKYIKKEYFSIFKSNIGSIKSFPSTARECLDKNGMLTHENLLPALHKIKEMEVFDFDENRTKKIKDYKKLYTDNWMSYFE